ncbi:hypothetical protein E4T52_17196 [Aureobasidium sp. EXF-3400]|nr:hypothetical protein E4T51_16454 [Aureobasidium sp. EXF-12344]KAI4767659.1 hypothetical protein E4T52_17196 [Aureobasidium sp. EXF-3400]
MSFNQDQPLAFTPTSYSQVWTHDDNGSYYSLAYHPRPYMVQPEALRPVEPHSMQNAARPYLPVQIDDPNQPRRQLSGSQQSSGPPLRTGPSSSFSASWPSVNNTQSNWSGGPWPSVTLPLPLVHRPSQIESTTLSPAPPFHRLSLDLPPIDRFPQPRCNFPLGARPSLPTSHPPPIPRSISKYRGPCTPYRLSQPTYSIDTAEQPRSEVAYPYHEDRSNDGTARRLIAIHRVRNMPSASKSSPRWVRQRRTPEEGMYYVCQDGSTFSTVIDGEPVNPLWGITKAGKARKRPAQACLNCRRKKIRCELGEKSCLQCDKTQRECYRFASPRSVADCPSKDERRLSVTHFQMELANSSMLAVPNLLPGQAECSTQFSDSILVRDVPNQRRRRSVQAVQQGVTKIANTWSRHRSPQSAKTRRFGVYPPSPEGDAGERQRRNSKWANIEDIDDPPPGPDKASPSSWDEDPYVNDAEATMRSLNMFFAQSAREAGIMFPRGTFTHWVRQCREKCQSEIMVLYVILAIGSIFAETEFSSFAKLCVERASQAVSRVHSKSSLAAVQARLLVARYNHLIGKDSTRWDGSGSAFRFISSMRLNNEEGCGEDLDEYPRRCYSFSREQLRECRRRTFWTAFLVDQYHEFPAGLLGSMQLEDIQLRLPCKQQIYEHGLPSDAPLFDCSQPGMGIKSLDSGSSVPSPSAYTMVVAALWTDVTRFIFRRPRKIVGPRSYGKSHESLQDDIQDKLVDWKNALPFYLRYSRQKLVEAIRDGYAGSIIAMHALYHISQLKAARHAHHELLSPCAIARQIRVSHSHATQLLEMTCDIRSTTSHGSGKDQDSIYLLSPFFAYGIASAIDTLSAGGLREDFGRTIELMEDSAATLHGLAQLFASAKVQSRQTSRRIALVKARAVETIGETAVMVTSGTTQSRENEACWRIDEPMEKVFPSQQDVSFGTSSTVYFTALSQRHQDIYE